MKEKEIPEKKIIVDIDNTLWYLAPHLWEQLKKVNPKMPPPGPVGHPGLSGEIYLHQGFFPGPERDPHAAGEIPSLPGLPEFPDRA